MNTLFLAAFFFAAVSEPYTIWRTEHVAKRIVASKPDEHKLSQDSLLHGAGYSMSVIKRQASGIGELHQNVTDILIIQSGECTLVVGGKLVSPKNTAPMEVRGSSVDGGEKQHLGPGDIVRISPKTPHQILVDSGKEVVYAAVKMESK